MSTINFAPLANVPNAHAALEAMHKIVFGPGRFARSAYRLREDVPCDAAQSTAAIVDGQMVGAVIMTPIKIGDERAMLLGPLAVLPEFERRGIGKELMLTSLNAARAAGEQFVLLVGDAPFYARMGFEIVPRGQIQFAGPVDPMRLLGCALGDGAMARMQGKTTKWAGA